MRVIIAEDSALLREGIRSLLLDEGHQVPAAVGDGQQLLPAVAAEQPDLVIIDVRMPPTHTDEGIQAALEIRRRWPEIGIIVLSQYVEPEFSTRLMSEGHALGYLLKDRVMGVDHFLDALERVHSGDLVLDPEVVRQLLERTTQTDPLARLTDREREVLEQMAQGRTNAGIARRLYISPSAVEKHANAIFDKLGLSASGGYSRRILAVLRFLGS
ncbi:response regulator transcription factor [Microlunatus elymi]|uniref:Response regulator transcription factor n=1 Tax=Microlunatus elymi TaxID=2596828 RepID=A0A516PZ10_9ACTN|nr:response regulator transcription factor [Microlunatus elymi]QDP96404.1 response regulator transcription factor [Microlunatus elymi]